MPYHPNDPRVRLGDMLDEGVLSKDYFINSVLNFLSWSELEELCEIAGINLECEVDDDCSCPGCGCAPGDGVTADCDHPDGCGYLK